MSRTRADAAEEAVEMEQAAEPAEAGDQQGAPPEPEFQPGDVVVVSETFHSPYFRGLTGVIDGQSLKSGSGQTLWPLKIDIPPYKTLIPAKYLRLKESAGGLKSGSTAGPSRKSFFGRLFSRRK